MRIGELRIASFSILPKKSESINEKLSDYLDDRVDDMALSLLWDLTLRAILVIAITDAVIFYVVSKRPITITWQLTLEIIVVTLVPLLIGIWFTLWRYGLSG